MTSLSRDEVDEMDRRLQVAQAETVEAIRPELEELRVIIPRAATARRNNPGQFALPLAEFKERRDALQAKIASIAKKYRGISDRQLEVACHNYIKETNDKAFMDSIFEGNSTSLLFLFDGTGSMRDELKGLKQQIRHAIKKLQECMGRQYFTYEIGAVVYRDVTDAQRFQQHEFSPSISGFISFLDNVTAYGGGDTCEDVIGGLAKALNMRFRYTNKLIIWCGDAPAHGRQYHGGSCTDDFPNGGFDGEQNGETVLRGLVQQGIQLHFLKMNSTTDTMIEKFKLWCPTMETHELDTTNMATISAGIRDTIIKATMTKITATQSILRNNAERNQLLPTKYSKFLFGIQEDFEDAEIVD